jgi:hypothetical protein
MRHRESLTPEQERDLEALDRALAGEPVEFELRELEELVRDVRLAANVSTRTTVVLQTYYEHRPIIPVGSTE